MKMTRLAATVIAAIAIAGCEGGGVDIGVETNDNSVDNSTNGGSGGGGNNPCASYTPPSSNEVRIGTFDGTNCVYPAAFVGNANPLLVDLTIPFISGVHIFQDSLFVGEHLTSGATQRAARDGAAVRSDDTQHDLHHLETVTRARGRVRTAIRRARWRASAR